jgi:hypothetical protein
MEKTKNKKEFRNDIRIDDKVKMLVGMLDRASNFSQHIDTQTNILLGICMAIFTFSVARFAADGMNWMLGILGGFSSVAALVCLFAIHPPSFMRKRGQRESLMYNKKITGFESHLKYSGALDKLFGDEDSIIKEYSSEIYNIYKYYYQPKRKLFKAARTILISGIVVSLVFFILNKLQLL